MPRTPGLSRSVITALLTRATSISAVVPYDTVGKSTLCQGLAQETFASKADLKRRARNAPKGAFLAVDFVMVPHAGVEMEGVTYHYIGQAHTRLGHQFTSAALVKFGEDPVPLLVSTAPKNWVFAALGEANSGGHTQEWTCLFAFRVLATSPS